MQNELAGDRGKERASVPLSVPLRAILKRCYACATSLESLSVLMQGLRSLVDADRVALLRASEAGRFQLIATHAGVAGPRGSAGVGSSELGESWSLLAERLVGSESDDGRNALLVAHAQAVDMGTAIAIPIHDVQPVRPGIRDEGITNGGVQAGGSSVLGAFGVSPEVVTDSEARDSVAARRPLGLLILEWGSVDTFRVHSTLLEEAIPWIRDACEVQLTRPDASWKRWWIARRWKWLAAGVLGLLLFQPIELWMEVDGSLQPTSQRFVFAPCDGYIEDFLVRDGQSVRSGDDLVRINSPELRLQRVQLESELRIVVEKRVGLEVSANQVSSRDESAALVAARIAGELEELKKRRESYEQQLEWLAQEEARLLQRAPIEGVVVTEPQWSEAQDRPVRRGDLIARIVSTEADWWVVGHVLDWESGYVADAWKTAQEEGRPLQAQFTLATDSRVIRSGVLSTIDRAFRNEAAGPSLDIRLEPSQRLTNPRVGATAKLRVPCGTRTRWFVWTRTVLDAIHRRFWV